jgi:hypothetical protein
MLPVVWQQERSRNNIINRHALSRYRAKVVSEQMERKAGVSVQAYEKRPKRDSA